MSNKIDLLTRHKMWLNTSGKEGNRLELTNGTALFRKEVLIGCNLSKSDISDSFFVGSNFSDGIFFGCDATNTDFSMSILKNIDFRQSFLSKAKLINCNLSNEAHR